MHLRFDRHTLASFLQAENKHIHVFFITAWCAWLKVDFVSTDIPFVWLRGFEQDSGITVYCSEEDIIRLDGAQLAVKDGRNYLVTPKVQSRCGCGTSLDFTKKQISTSMEKLHGISTKLAKLGLLKK